MRYKTHLLEIFNHNIIKFRRFKFVKNNLIYNFRKTKDEQIKNIGKSRYRVDFVTNLNMFSEPRSYNHIVGSETKNVQVRMI